MKKIPNNLKNDAKLARAIHDFGTFYKLCVQNNMAGMCFMNRILAAGFSDAEDFYNTARETPEDVPPDDFLRRRV